MNYLFYCKDSIPDYLKITLNSVLSVDKDAKIFICSNKDPKFKNVEFIPLTEVISESTKSLLFQNIEDKNPLTRICYLHDAQSELNIKSFVHLENDVLLYKSFSEVKSVFQENKLNITKQSNSKILFGYSLFNSADIIHEFKNKMLEIIKYGTSTNWSFNYGVPYAESDLLGRLYDKNKNLFNLLPILPHEGEFLFDPSSYGHFIDGTESHPKKLIGGRFINHDHYIGREIKSKRIKIKFKNQKPIVSWKEKDYEVANLNIYSKRFHKFLPKQYKEYV